MILPHLELKCAPVLLARRRILLLCPQFICNCQDSLSSSTDWASACKSCRVDHRLLGSLVGKLGLHHHLLNVGLGQSSPRLTRSSWLNSALRDDEAVYWVSIGHYEAVAVGNWWHWVSRGHFCLYTLHKVQIWKGVTDARQTTLEDRATQPMNHGRPGWAFEQSKLIRQKNSTNIKNSTVIGMGNSMVLGDLQLWGDDKHRVVETAFAPC